MQTTLIIIHRRWDDGVPCVTCCFVMARGCGSSIQRSLSRYPNPTFGDTRAGMVGQDCLLRLISRAISWLIIKGWEVNVFKSFVMILGVLSHRIIGIYHGSVMRTWWGSVEFLYFRKEFFDRRFAWALLGGGKIHQLGCRIIWRCLRWIFLFFWVKIQEGTKDFSFWFMIAIEFT